MAKDPERVTLSFHVNRKTNIPRMAIQFPESLGLKIAAGNIQAGNRVLEAITERMTKRERDEE